MPALFLSFERGFVFSPFVASAPELTAYAAPSFEVGRPLVSAVQDLSHRIHSEFTYKPTSTAIDTPLLEVLRCKCGCVRTSRMC